MPPGNIEFGGSERFDRSPAEVYGLLTDADRLPALLPDLVSCERIDESTLYCVVTPGFSFLRGKLKIRLSLVPDDAARSATITSEAKGIGVEIHTESRFTAQPDGAGCVLSWSSRVTHLRGLVTSVSTALVRAAAERVIRQTWDRVRAALEA